VFLAAYSGGGSCDFITWYIFDIAPARALDIEIYERINLTDLRRVALGDRWTARSASRRTRSAL
jgi:hypothetical protein